MRLKALSLAAPGVLLLGSAVTFSVFWDVRSAAVETRSGNFRLEASQRAERIIDKLQNDFSDLDALRRLFEGSEVVDLDEFLLFTEPMLEKDIAREVLWVPRVPRDALAAFEESVRADGLPEFAVRALPKETAAPPDAHTEYFPVRYAVPLMTGREDIGADLNSDSELRDAMFLASRSGKPAILFRRLVPGAGQSPATPAPSDASQVFQPTLLMIPVYTSRTPGVSPDRSALQGFVVGVCDLGRTMEQVIAETPALGLPTILSSVEDDGDIIYEHAPRLGTKSNVLNGLLVHNEFVYANQRFRITVMAGTGFLDRHPVNWTFAILPMGLLSTALTALLIQNQLAGRRRAEALVARRTEELRANERMLNAQARALRLLIHTADHCETQLREALRVLGDATGADVVCLCSRTGVSKHRDDSAWWSRLAAADARAIHERCRDALGAPGPWLQTLLDGDSVRATGTDSSLHATRFLGLIGVRSLIAAPYAVDRDLGGALVLLHADQERAYLESEIKILESTASSIGLMLERHEAEGQLRTLAERLRLATTAADVGIWDWDLAEDRLIWDRRLADMHGIDMPPEREFIAEWLQRVHPDDLHRMMDEARKAVDGEGPFDVEYRIVRPDGTVRHVHSMATITKDGGGQSVRMTGVIWDVTQRKTAEEKQRESERFIRAVLDAVPAHICVLDQSGVILAVNHAWHELARLMDVPPKSVSEGVPFLHVMRDVYRLDEAHARSLEDALAHLRDDERSGSVVEYRFDVRGSARWFIAKVLPIPQSRPPRVLVVHEDVTLLKNALEERIEMERRVLHSQKLESLGVLAGGIAHDFNNLLMVILGNLDLASHDLVPGSSGAVCVNEAIQAARRAADLSRQMLAYTGKGRFVVSAVDLNALVSEIAHLLQVSISKTVVLELGLASELPAILADSAQLQQIVMNLITNASEAIGDRVGHIRIATGVEACDDGGLSRSCLSEHPPAGRFVYLDVVDSGSGMDRETRQRLFDPFFTTKFTGRGLGMAAVLGIVRGHSGAIFVDSEPGRGTRIRVLFPVLEDSDADAAEHHAADAVVAGASQSKRLHGTVLIVDDEPAVRTLCASMVDRLGLNALTASDGEDALRVYREHDGQIDCALLDLTMPKMDGMAVFAEIRRHWPAAKVILSSGYSEEEVAGRFSTEGLSGFVQKPYTIRSLREAFEGVLGNHPG